ncbi:MAG: cardiolipin synthase [Treponema sp.]|nr:cardiolipin synthase [Treponema sp.]
MAHAKKVSPVALRRGLFIVLALLGQLALLGLLLAGAELGFSYANLIFGAVSVGACVHVLNRNTKAAYKITWIFLILLVPVFGSAIYLFFYFQSTPRRLKRLMDRIGQETRPAFFLGGDALPALSGALPLHEPLARYLQRCAGFPAFANTRALYLDSGEAFFAKALEELEKARRYIFLEFFILREGRMLSAILDVLERKAAEGLDVRVIYDDLGCFLSLPPEARRDMEARGIKCFAFNPFRPVLASLQNNRNHRKIIAIDGKVAFTGGVNIGDEYINLTSPYGRWKDAGVMLEGEGAWSFALIFLQMWGTSPAAKGGARSRDDCASFYPWRDAPCDIRAEGFVQPYSDSPMDPENVCENVYLQIIGRARKYVYINTPYLVPDDSLLSALALAAKSGVDVRIITPHRWDKWIVAFISRSYYRELISAGVKVYEYADGFNHGKTFACDDEIATVGTANLDFRSLYLHFECGAVAYSAEIARAVKEDFLRTLPVSREMTLEECAPNVFKRALSDVLRILAPLL